MFHLILPLSFFAHQKQPKIGLVLSGGDAKGFAHFAVLKDIDIFKDIKSGSAVGYSYNSIVDPVEIKYSWSPDNNQN